MATYYIPIESIYLPLFYGRACIIPRKYFNTDHKSIQDNFPTYLLLSKFKNIKNSNCSVEIAFSEFEESELIHVSENFFLSKFPIPLSRVKRIFFKSNDVRERTVAIINLSTAYLNPKITSNIDINEIEYEIEYKDYKIGNNIDLTSSIDKFDRLLGGFALLNTVEGHNKKYSDNYFQALASFNELIKQKLINNNIEPKSKLQDAFFGKERFEDLYPYLNKVITEKDLKTLAENENQIISTNKLTGIIDLENLDKMTYVLSFLYSYGVGEEAKKSKIDSFIVNGFLNRIKPKFSEIIGLCYGINRGYHAFAKDYKISDKNKEVKFKLDNIIDFYTIESLYQFSFYNKLNNSYFKYLNEIFDIINISEEQIDVLINVRPKFGTKEYINQLCQNFMQKEFTKLLLPFFESIINIIKQDIERERKSMIESASHKTMQENIILLKKINSLEDEKKQLASEIQKINIHGEKLNNNLLNEGSNSQEGQENINMGIDDKLNYLIISIEKTRPNKAISKILEKFKNDNTLL